MTSVSKLLTGLPCRGRGTAVDDSQPGLTAIADPDGNRGVLGVDLVAAGIA